MTRLELNPPVVAVCVLLCCVYCVYIGQTSQVVVYYIIFDWSASDNRQLQETEHEYEYLDVKTLIEEDSDSLCYQV